MTTVIRVLWLVLAGIWLALGYALAGVVSGLLTGGGPFAAAALQMSRYALWPFDRTLVARPVEGRGTPVTTAVWLVTGGWWLALVHLVVGVALCLTIIGLPFGVVSLTLLPVALGPRGAHVLPARVRLDTVGTVGPVGTVTRRDLLVAA